MPGGKQVRRLLLDSHALVWFLNGDERLSSRARTALAADDATLFVSAATVWEIATKVRLQKWAEAAHVAGRFHQIFELYSFVTIPISIEHARLAGTMPGAHGDPFDRMLAAQSRIEQLPIVTVDRAFQAFGSHIV